MRQLHRQTLELLRAAMLLEWGSGEGLELPDHALRQLRELVNQLPSWRILRALKVWGDVSLRYDAPSTLPLELAAVEICNEEVGRAAMPEATPAGMAGTAPPASQPSRATGTQPQRNAPPRRSPASQAPPPTDAGGMGEPATVPAGDGNDLRQKWLGTVKALGRCKGKKYNLGALLRDCKSDAVSIDDDTLVLPFTNRTNLERMEEEMADPAGRQTVTETVEKFFGTAYQFRLTLTGETDGNGGPRQTQQHSPLVRAALGIGARIVEEQSE